MEFLNSLLNYLFIMLVIVILCGISIYIGIFARKKKNAKELMEAEGKSKEE